MNRNITTILFDLDGTLINTNELIIASFLHTLEHYYPSKYKREDVFPFIGPTLKESFESIDAERAADMMKMYREFNWEKHDELVNEYEGVNETIKALKESGFKLAIVSTKLYDVIIKGLQLTGLEPYFDVVIGLDQVEKAKPDPEPLLKALALLDSKPEEALMVGDNYHDILGGKNTGTLTAGVAWSLKGKDYLQTFEPNFMLETMSDLLHIVGVDGK